jgi:hypothetical protein
VSSEIAMTMSDDIIKAMRFGDIEMDSPETRKSRGIMGKLDSDIQINRYAKRQNSEPE